MRDQFSEFEAMLGGASLPLLAAAETAAPIKTEEQRHAEWLEQRWGKFTASEFHRLMTYENKLETLPKGGWTYATEKAVECLTECRPDAYVSPDMQWGIDHEAEAVALFESCMGVTVKSHGKDQEFIRYGDHSGGTPDGLIQKTGLFDAAGIEVKCPKSKTHVEYLLIQDSADLKEAAPEYYWQCQGLMMITGHSRWFFISYDPRFKAESLRLHFAIIEKSDTDIEKLQMRLDMAIRARDDIISRISGTTQRAMEDK